MDSVRFGRALGAGARVAAKTLVTAVDAATAPNPTASQRATPAGGPKPESKDPGSVQRPAARAGARVEQTRRGVVQGGKRFGEAVWGPFVRLSGVLWLEMAGVFFGLFAVFAATGAWKLRGALHSNELSQDDHSHLLLALGMAVVFGYFSISSFVKAKRRERRR